MKSIEYTVSGEYVEFDGLEYLATSLVKNDEDDLRDCTGQIDIANWHVDVPIIARGFVHVPTGNFTWIHCSLLIG